MKVLLCPLASPGYLYPAISVALELQRRGHTTSTMVRSEHEALVGSALLDAIRADECGMGRAFRVDRWFISGREQYVAVSRAIRAVAPDVVVTSLLCHGALLAAERFDVPAVVLGLATHLLPYRAGGDIRREPVVLRQWRLGELLENYHGVREQIGMRPRHDIYPDVPLIASAMLLRGHGSLEVPGARLPENIHHVGPCLWEPAADPTELDDVRRRLAERGKPVVYVHLGRTFGGDSLWPRLNSTFRGGTFQALVERGRSGHASPAQGTDITVVRKPWMGPLVDLADVVLTNATTAPVLTAVSYRKPMAVAPAGSEQPLLADACVRVGVAARFPDDVTGTGRTVLAQVRSDRSLHSGLGRLGDRLERLRGPAAAADVIMKVVGCARPQPVGSGVVP